MQTPIEAEELLSILRRSIAQTSTVLRSDSAFTMLVARIVFESLTKR